MIRRLFNKTIKCKECNYKILKKDIEIEHIHDDHYPEDYRVDWYITKCPNCQQNITLELYVKNELVMSEL